MAEPVVTEESGGFITNLILEIVQSPINIALVFVIAFLVYKILKSHHPVQHTPSPPEPQLPKLRRDFTVEELKKYDGRSPDGRVLVAVNGTVYDVTKGTRFYGPGGPYAAFGGRDASRGLATFSVGCVKDEFDDLSDLNSMEMESVREWEAQFKEKYELVGQLLKQGEEHRNYSDEEDEAAAGDKAKDE